MDWYLSLQFWIAHILRPVYTHSWAVPSSNLYWPDPAGGDLTLPSSTTRTDKPQALSTSGLFCSWIKQRWQESLFLFVYFLHKLTVMLTGGLASLVANKVRVRMSTYLLRDTIQLTTPSKWKMKPYSTNPFVAGSFHSVRWSWDSFILSYVVVVSSVSLLHNTPFCKLPAFSYPFYCWWTCGSFLFNAIMNRVAMNIQVYVFWLTYVCISLGLYVGFTK